LSWLRSRQRGELLLVAVILLVFTAVVVNVPSAVNDAHLRKRDKKAFFAWTKANGGRRAYGISVPEVHSKYDVVCSPHFRPVPGKRRGHPDYRVYLLVDSHGEGTPRVVRAVKGPLKVKATATGPKCGAPPAAP
jgi:hypothetical protein